MNRLGPLIVRRVGPLAVSAGYAEGADEPAAPSELFEDLKMFAVVWLGGLIFFGTYIA